MRFLSGHKAHISHERIAVHGGDDPFGHHTKCKMSEEARQRLRFKKRFRLTQ